MTTGRKKPPKYKYNAGGVPVTCEVDDPPIKKEDAELFLKFESTGQRDENLRKELESRGIRRVGDVVESAQRRATVSNPLEVKLSNGRKIQFRAVHVPNPPVSVENPSGVTEDYYVLQEDSESPTLIRVSFRSPLTLEQVDTTSPKGAGLWNQVDGYLNNGK